MRISDWSSDVCSSDLFRHPEFWALSSWLDIIVRARKSRFGILWLLAPSVVYVFGLGTFFRGMQPGAGTGDFFVHVALGAMIFRTLMSSVIGSANVFHGSVSFIMDGHMRLRSEEHTSELQSLIRIPYA